MQATEFTSIATRQRLQLLSEARAILHDEEEAEDAVQEALLALWRWRDRVDMSREVEPLLRRILRNCCLNALHARRRRQATQTPLDELPGSILRSLTALTNDPQATMEQKELEQRIRLALSQLPPRWQTVLTMKLMDGLPNPQIAAILGLSETATSSLINRARQALMGFLHNKLHELNELPHETECKD